MGKLSTSCRLHMRHMVAATRFSLAGLAAAFRTELAFRQIVFLSAIGIPVAVLLAEGWVETVLLILPLFLSLIVELLNTAIEKTVDRISLERHPLAKFAKDAGSAAQFVAQLFIAVVWVSYVIDKYF